VLEAGTLWSRFRQKRKIRNILEKGKKKNKKFRKGSKLLSKSENSDQILHFRIALSVFKIFLVICIFVNLNLNNYTPLIMANRMYVPIQLTFCK
jgi:hypothetical protein